MCALWWGPPDLLSTAQPRHTATAGPEGVSPLGQISSGVLGVQLRQTLSLSRLVWAIAGPHASLMG